LLYEVYCIYFHTLVPADLKTLHTEYYRSFMAPEKTETIDSGGMLSMDTIYRSNNGDIKQFVWGCKKHTAPGFVWNLNRWGPGGSYSGNVYYDADINRTIAEPVTLPEQSASARMSVMYDHKSTDTLDDASLREEIIKHLSSLM
jgi:hypothetical protein